MSFDREYAVVLPDGSFLQQMRQNADPTGYFFGSLFGPPPEPTAEGVRIFRTEADAQRAVDGLREQAQKVGVSDLFARVVCRVCGPWLVGDIGESIADEMGTFLRGEQ